MLTEQTNIKHARRYQMVWHSLCIINSFNLSAQCGIPPINRIDHIAIFE